MLVTAAAFLPLLRQTGVPSWQTVWAEDGAVFTQQASLDGALAALFRAYAGYHAVPRLLGAVASAVPASYLALYFATAATTVGALLAWFTWNATRGWVDSPAVRVAVASMVVLMPVLGPENTAEQSPTPTGFLQP